MTELRLKGDFSSYVAARQGGMSVDLVPTYGPRPSPGRGWFGYANAAQEAAARRSREMLKIVFALSTTTVAAGDGRHVTVNQGEHWPASDPVVRAYPGLFTDDLRHGLRVSTPLKEDEDASKPETPVEQATKAPGEKRPTRRA